VLPLAGLPYRVRHGLCGAADREPPGTYRDRCNAPRRPSRRNCSPWCSSPLNQIRSGIFTNEAWEHRRGLIREKAGEQEYRGAPQSHRVPEGSRCAPRSISARDGPGAMGRTDNHRAVIDCALVGHLVGSLAVNFDLAGVELAQGVQSRAPACARNRGVLCSPAPTGAGRAVRGQPIGLRLLQRAGKSFCAGGSNCRIRRICSWHCCPAALLDDRPSLPSRSLVELRQLRRRIGLLMKSFDADRCQDVNDRRLCAFSRQPLRSTAERPPER
jgi:hypothetical protein